MGYISTKSHPQPIRVPSVVNLCLMWKGLYGVVAVGVIGVINPGQILSAELGGRRYRVELGWV